MWNETSAVLKWAHCSLNYSVGWVGEWAVSLRFHLLSENMTFYCDLLWIMDFGSIWRQVSDILWTFSSSFCGVGFPLQLSLLLPSCGTLAGRKMTPIEDAQTSFVRHNFCRQCEISPLNTSNFVPGFPHDNSPLPRRMGSVTCSQPSLPIVFSKLQKRWRQIAFTARSASETCPLLRFGYRCLTMLMAAARDRHALWTSAGDGK